MTVDVPWNALGSVMSGLLGNAGSAGAWQQALMQSAPQYNTVSAINTTSGTATITSGPTHVILVGEPLPRDASPADPPEYLWLKRRIDDVCWAP
jgi:hypothetical protein